MDDHPLGALVAPHGIVHALNATKKKKAKGKAKEVVGENLLLALETFIAPESITNPEALSGRKSKHPSEDVEDEAGPKRQKLTHNQKAAGNSKPQYVSSVTLPFSIPISVSLCLEV